MNNKNISSTTPNIHLLSIFIYIYIYIYIYIMNKIIILTKTYWILDHLSIDDMKLSHIFFYSAFSIILYLKNTLCVRVCLYIYIYIYIYINTHTQNLS